MDLHMFHLCDYCGQQYLSTQDVSGILARTSVMLNLRRRLSKKAAFI